MKDVDIIEQGNLFFLIGKESVLEKIKYNLSKGGYEGVKIDIAMRILVEAKSPQERFLMKKEIKGIIRKTLKGEE